MIKKGPIPLWDQTMTKWNYSSYNKYNIYKGEMEKTQEVKYIKSQTGSQLTERFLLYLFTDFSIAYRRRLKICRFKECFLLSL